PDDDARRLIGDGLAARVHATRVAPVLGSVLSFITSDSRHQDLLDDALGLIEQSVRENREIIRVKVAEESPWWMPEVVDERIYLKIVGAIENLLREVRESPDHPLRAKFHEARLVKFRAQWMVGRFAHLAQEILDRANDLEVDALVDHLRHPPRTFLGNLHADDFAVLAHRLLDQ